MSAPQESRNNTGASGASKTSELRRMLECRPVRELLLVVVVGRDRRSALRRETPELRFVEERDPMAFFPQSFDLHQFQSAIASRRLLNVRPAAHDNGGAHRWHAV